MAKPTNPFQIGIQYNEAMKCFDVILLVGNLKDRAEAQKFSDILSDWMISDSSTAWKQRVS